MECAAKLLDNKCDVTVVFPESRLMERLFTPEMAQWYEDIYTSKGCKFVKGAGNLVTQVHGSTTATGVTLKNGESAGSRFKQYWFTTANWPAVLLSAVLWYTAIVKLPRHSTVVCCCSARPSRFFLFKSR